MDPKDRILIGELNRQIKGLRDDVKQNSLQRVQLMKGEEKRAMVAWVFWFIVVILAFWKAA